jgi:ketosteroid isomerase-like protein
MTDPKILAVQEMYEAFGKGDVDAILAKLTDDVDWGSVTDSEIAPWHGATKGKQNVPRFFEALAKTSDITEFTPLAFAANDTDVMAVIRFESTIRANGRSGVTQLHHWWRFRGDKVYYFRGTEDTAQVAAMLGA